MRANATHRPCSIWPRDQKQSRAVEADLKSLKAAIAESADLRRLLASPGCSADDKAKGLAAIADGRKFNPTTKKFLGLLAANGRASHLRGGHHRLREAVRRSTAAPSRPRSSPPFR